MNTIEILGIKKDIKVSVDYSNFKILFEQLNTLKWETWFYSKEGLIIDRETEIIPRHYPYMMFFGKSEFNNFTTAIEYLKLKLNGQN